MADLKNNISSKPATCSNTQEDANIYEDEINLIDYFLVFWKRKWFIFLASVLPALIVGLVIFFLPRSYELTYVYDLDDYTRDEARYDTRDEARYDVGNWNLDEKSYNVFVSRFYSDENLNNIVSKLQENGYNEHAKSMTNAGSNLNGLQKLVKFEPVPSYIDLSKVKITDPEQLEQIRKLTAQLLNVTIIGRPKDRFIKMASVVRDNIEQVVPMYSIQREVINTINKYRAKMGDIEKSRFNIELNLKRNKAVLAKLEEIKVGVSDKTEDNVTLQFDVGGRSEYLPLGYQIRAAEAKIIEFEENIKINTGKYNYYKNLLALNEKLSAELAKSVSSYYTIQQYHSFLTELIGSCESEELKDYLASYIKAIENRISTSVPISENPKISPVAKGIA
ncbi:MAG: hypothetical protein ISS77_00250, partial [Phycisphaerae bacterium]|nr:hypothetical protein [Phycisphaerae bacterium]